METMKDDDKNINIVIWIMAAIPFALTLILATLFYSRFGVCVSERPVPNTFDSTHEFSCLFTTAIEQWGQTGDFFGGILNPFIGLITMGLVIISIKQNQKALKQSQIALGQNETALKQNEIALRNSRDELKISNQVMSDQKDLMAFDLKHRILLDILKDIRFEETKERTISNAMRVDVKYNLNRASRFYIRSQLNDDLTKEIDKGIASDFTRIAADLGYLFIGIRSVYLSFPINSEFRETIALSLSIHIRSTTLYAYALYLLNGSDLAAVDDSVGRIEVAEILVHSLKVSGHYAQVEVLTLRIDKLKQSEN